ncbi:MAG TPA: NADH-quinone oxidoreductase subunit L [Spirochaetia bacterium]|nr:NADH-quinone oxidoreductase subunit L [Spirochaetia bacterium]
MSWMWLIPALPLLGSLLLGVLGRRMPAPWVAAVGTGSVGLSMLLAIAAVWGGSTVTLTLWEWVRVGGFSPSISLTLDALSGVMILVVTGIGFLIHLYSVRFMAGEEGYSRFFAYMNLFVGSMLLLVLAGNLLLLYLGWEGVGLCSYLLIGFWYSDPENGRSARKAFIVTRVGDVALAIGLFLIATNLGTLDIADVARRATASWGPGSTLAVAAAALILGGAVGKSAQLPLQTWLPDAMAGPSPVSALIHAATMVTAGVYLIARTNALFVLAPAVMSATAIIGIAGVLFAGFSALAQTNIKRVLAYSTMSQLGYMFLALGVGAWSGAIFHLVTHAFFKSLLFLAAGVVILAMNHEHDMFSMGGLARKTPYTFAVFLIGALALTALPPTTSGFASKELILSRVWESGGVGRLFWLLGVLGVFVTSAYTFRLVFTVFGGQPHGGSAGHGANGKSGLADGPDGRQAGLIMGAPLAVLAVLCITGGFLDFPRNLGGRPFLTRFLETTLPAWKQVGEMPSGADSVLQVISEVASLLGVPVGWLISRRAVRAAAERRPGELKPAFVRFFLGGMGFDWLYDRAFVRPFLWLWKLDEHDVADRIPDGVGGLSMLLSRVVRLTQNGRVRWYAAGVAVGAVLVIAAAVLL